MKLGVLLFTFFNAIIYGSNGYKILGVFPTMAKSHYIVGSTLMKALAERGHEVTVLNPFPQKTAIKNYRDVTNIEVFEAMKATMSNIVDMRHQSMVQGLIQVFGMGLTITNATFQSPNVKKFIAADEKFDLVITEIFLNEAMVGFGHRYKAPVIGISTFGASIWTCQLVGSPAPPSYVPNPFLAFTDHMTFIERVGNFLVTTFEKIYNDLIYLPKQEALYQAAFPGPKPPLTQLLKDVSFVLLNNHFSLSFPRPYVPNMVEVGGMHVNRKPKPLPDNLKRFLDSAAHGAIYFSMGSNLKGNQLPVKIREAILKAFAPLKQKILWKFEDPQLPGKTDNIMISDWFPQDDILAHPNVKMFITHGGLLSSTEAVYHGVPIIGIPMFGDQHLNMGRAEAAGYGITVEYDQLTTETLSKAIHEILSKPKYTETMKSISAIYRDQPMNPLEKAIYWVEYVLRHKGAPHLHSAGQDLNFFQYHNLDVFALLIGSVVFVLYLLCALCRKICCSGSAKKSSKELQKKKRN